MRPASLPSIAVIAVAACAVAGCNDIGYVELKTVPQTVRAPTLYLDSEPIDPPRAGFAVLRQSVGTRKLQAKSAGGELSVLCEIMVRKDRISMVTVSMLERPPHCQCARPSGQDAQGRRLCLG